MKNMNRKERSESMCRTGHAIMNLCVDLQSFREALAILQRQVDDLDDLKKAHYQDIMDHEEEVWDVVQSKVLLPLCCAPLYAQFTINDRSAWSCGRLWTSSIDSQLKRTYHSHPRAIVRALIVVYIQF